MTELPKTFSPAELENRWYAHWEETGQFHPDRPNAEPWTIVNPPPNVTGSLHIGHALDNTLQDILVRHARLQGKDALWVVGTDHAGIATQMVVERQMAEKQDKRTNYSREQFVEKVWDWKRESGGQITQQLRRLGCSMDWANERFTMDEGFSKAVLKVFVDLYNEGLLYRDKRLVNWDPGLGTAISDLEVETREVQGKFWHLKYPLADGSGFIEVATTRPETMLADMAVAVHPTDARYTALIGKTVKLPITGREIPIVADEHADPELGSGAVKITPGHDFNDFEVGKRAGFKPAEMLNMLDAKAQVTQTADGLIPADLIGLDRFEARDRVVKLLDEAGALVRIEDRVIQTPYGDRSGVVIEPWLTDQWYVDAATLAKPAIEAVRSGKIKIVPKTWEKTFFNWMENIQPWCVSRQLWWGHRIPVWYGPRAFSKQERAGTSLADTVYSFQKLDGLENSGNILDEVRVCLTADEAVRAFEEYYREKVGNRRVRLCEDERAADALLLSPDFDPQSEVAIWQDGDVLDTWFSSALWPFATMGWPEGDQPEWQRRYPNDVLISGFDILFFWDARMMMQGLHFLGDVPFHTLYLHGLVRAADGAKMSKSKGNTVDPLGLIDQYGADALRFFMAAMESQGRDIKMDESRVAGYRNFATKLWNAARFCQANGIGASTTLDAPAAAHAVNKWIIAETVETIQAVDLALADYRFDGAANAIYQFAWSRFCDWYLELIKGQIDDETKAVAGWVLDQILVLLHPFMPFITEELWHALGERQNDLIVAQWPKADARALDAEAVREIDCLIRLVSDLRTARTELNVPPGARVPLHLITNDRDVVAQAGGRMSAQEATLCRLARVQWVSAGNFSLDGAVAQIVVDGLTYALSLEGIIDLDAERARLTKAIEAAAKERDALAARLANPNFVERAKPEAVEKARADHADKAAEADRLQAALARLG
ncbi:valine--tRNA ligase [Hephaestia mangrovi]|uniref:valine--tRNA ligase n=1 Tax=Hephaestia mangrovi TaxID=2873268 RepID=UPI001CA6840F|nr:valine--tRNA ligase [Hephaestia mangrovi]MBY8827617.1 valine--tRNA ligase [Hephaestia mangrovi]